MPVALFSTRELSSAVDRALADWGSEDPTVNLEVRPCPLCKGERCLFNPTGYTSCFRCAGTGVVYEDASGSWSDAVGEWSAWFSGFTAGLGV